MFEPMGDNTNHRPKYDTTRNLQLTTIRQQFLKARNHSTDADAETLTEQEMPIFVALRDEKCAQYKGYRGNK
jgi:hypothetical protein